MQEQAQTTPPPIGLAASAAMFGTFSVALWLATAAAIPWLRDAFGVPPIIGWYVTGTAFVLVPMLIFGCLMAWRELPKPDLASLRTRLRLNAMNRGDILWTIGGLVAIAAATAAILGLARLIDPGFRPSPWFLQQPRAGTLGCLRHGFRCSSATSSVRKFAGGVTCCLVRKQDLAASRGFQTESCGVCFTGVLAGRSWWRCCRSRCYCPGSCSGGETRRSGSSFTACSTRPALSRWQAEPAPRPQRVPDFPNDFSRLGRPSPFIR